MNHKTCCWKKNDNNTTPDKIDEEDQDGLAFLDNTAQDFDQEETSRP